jgi:hypothetical protein
MIARALRPPTPRPVEHEQVDAEWAAIVAAMAKDRGRRRRRETAYHAVLIVVFCVVALVRVGTELARLLLPAAAALGWPQ